MDIQRISDRKNLLIHKIYFTVVAGLFFSSLIISKGQDVLFVNGGHTPFLDDVFRIITNLGDGLIFIPIVVATLFVRYQYAVVAVLACVVHGLLSGILKHVIFAGMDRPRNVIDNDLLYFVPGVDVHGAHSFPSGHTATAFCAAVFITLLCRNRIVGFIALLLALLVGCSRIYLLQHFLIDVAAGATIGAFTSYALWQIFAAGPKREWMNRKLRFNKPQRRSPSSLNQGV